MDMRKSSPRLLPRKRLHSDKDETGCQPGGPLWSHRSRYGSLSGTEIQDPRPIIDEIYHPMSEWLPTIRLSVLTFEYTRIRCDREVLDASVLRK
jgi:hypothetical protein